MPQCKNLSSRVKKEVNWTCFKQGNYGVLAVKDIQLWHIMERYLGFKLQIKAPMPKTNYTNFGRFTNVSMIGKQVAFKSKMSPWSLTQCCD